MFFTRRQRKYAFNDKILDCVDVVDTIPRVKAEVYINIENMII